MPLLILLFILFNSSQALAAQVLELNVNQQKVSLPFWQASPEIDNQGGVLFVQGGEPAYGWSSLKKISELLAKMGWSVAILHADKNLQSAWADLLPEALSAMRRRTSKRLILIHYGDEFKATLNYFAKPQAKQVAGLVLLSAFQMENDNRDDDTGKLVSKLRFPVFELRGQFDYDAVLTQSQSRRFIFPRKSYRAVLLPGAFHDYGYCRNLVAVYLNGWMKDLESIEPLAKSTILNPN